MVSGNELIGLKVISKDFGEGTIVAVNDGKADIAFPGGAKTFALEIAVSRGSLRFEDDAVNSAFGQKQKDDALKKEKLDSYKNASKEQRKEKKEWLKKQAKALMKERDLRLELFGGDYVYEEFEQFRKKYRNMILNYLSYHEARQILEDNIFKRIDFGTQRVYSFGISDHF